MDGNILDAILGIKKVLLEMKGSFFLFLFPTMQRHLEYVSLL